MIAFDNQYYQWVSLGSRRSNRTTIAPKLGGLLIPLAAPLAVQELRTLSPDRVASIEGAGRCLCKDACCSALGGSKPNTERYARAYLADRSE